MQAVPDIWARKEDEIRGMLAVEWRSIPFFEFFPRERGGSGVRNNVNRERARKSFRPGTEKGRCFPCGI